MHNNDTITSKYQQPHSQNGTINIIYKDADSAPAREEADYITIFPQDTPEAEVSPEDVREETPYDNSLVVRSKVTDQSEATGDDDKTKY
jgi:hypothetical protein